MKLNDKRGVVRPPAVAGAFYPEARAELDSLIHSSFLHRLGPGTYPNNLKNVKGNEKRLEGVVECLIVPHAGYIYSGPVAAHSYLRIREIFFSSPSNENRAAKLSVIIFGPNHYGIGSGIAASPSEFWQTPYGDVAIDSVFTKTLVKTPAIIDIDFLAHSREHSIEVQIPFLQYVSAGISSFSFVPISMMLQDYETSMQVASIIESAIKSCLQKDPNRNFLVLGSSDLTHYEPRLKASKNDAKLLEEVDKLDISGFYRVLERNNISACGYGPIAVTMASAKAFGKKRGLLLKYSTSGDVSGDESSVVGYSAVHFQ